VGNGSWGALETACVPALQSVTQSLLNSRAWPIRT
jgi:hypothetical protein